MLEWIRARLPAGSRLLELGCGPGNFLAALVDAGYEAYGLDISATAVERLRRLGFRTAAGTIRDYPAGWPEVEAVVMIEVLEHLEDPAGVLGAIRERFPRAALLLTVPSPRFWMARRGRMAADYPPNHLTRWAPAALERLLQRVGYGRVEVEMPPPSPAEWTGSGLTVRLVRGAGRLNPAAGQKTAVRAARWGGKARWYVLWPYMQYLRGRGYSAASLVAIAR